MISVALVGADGAGKSSVSEQLMKRRLPAPVKSIYMGVNLDASSLMLPTTRLVLAIKRARGGRADMTATAGRVISANPAGGSRSRRVVRSGVRGVRMCLWLAEEWFRQLVAAAHRRRGTIVVFDRHFFADYYHYDVAGHAGARPLSSRVHGWLLRHLYPMPDLVVCLDAPGAVLFERKHEADPEWLEGRRQQYLSLADVLPQFRVVDVDRPLDRVIDDIVEIITEFWERRV